MRSSTHRSMKVWVTSISVAISARTNSRVLERSDVLPERATLLDIAKRVLERRASFGHPGDGDRHPLLRELGDELEEALILLAEQVGERNAHVGERQLGRVLRVHADLLQVAAPLKARHASFENEQRQPAVPIRASTDGGDHEVGVDAVCDERLRPVHDVLAAVTHRAGPDSVRSEPAPGSVMATAVISSPDTMPGSQRRRCWSVA